MIPALPNCTLPVAGAFRPKRGSPPLLHGMNFINFRSALTCTRLRTRRGVTFVTLGSAEPIPVVQAKAGIHLCLPLRCHH